MRCIVYIDMNMVRARVVEHPSPWIHGGYREIQAPRRKCILIDYDRLRKLCGFDDFESFQATHRKWVETAVNKEISKRESTWTQAERSRGRTKSSNCKDGKYCKNTRV